MENFKIENLSFSYPDRGEKALDCINLTVNQGEFITVCGKSGCGKTTLLRLLKPALSPCGNRIGEIFFKGRMLSETDSREQASEIGFVMQSPDNQIVTDKVWHELAFGLESLGFSNGEIRTRVSEMASFFGIQTWFYKKVTELSGGQKQLLNLASVMVMQPSVLILDEPTSQLDPIAAQEFIRTVEKINRELGTTVIITEHRLEEVFPVSDRVIVMDNGKIIVDDLPVKVAGKLKEIKHEMFDALPASVRIYGSIEKDNNFPVTVRDGRIWFENYSGKIDYYKYDRESIICDDTVIEIKDAWFRYDRELPDVIKGLNLKINRGEFFAIVGGNGTGKTTALSLIAGLNKPYRGKIIINGENSPVLNSGMIGVLPQNPQSVFVKKTAFDDLKEALSDRKLSDSEIEEKVSDVALLCEINTLLDRHPYDLSGGEQQRLAFAKILLFSPKIILLDEPTKGLDAHFKKVFSRIIKKLNSSGVTVIMVSHDIEFCAEYADRCAMFFDGNITSISDAKRFFAGNSFYTTSANRMVRTKLPEAVTVEDVIEACGGEVIKTETNQNDKSNFFQNQGKHIKTETKEKKHKISKRTIISMLMILIAVPVTIFAGMFLFQDRKYYFISLLIILETMIPFFMMFEDRKPRARELVTVSVLCAAAVAGRMAFYMLPQFKPVIAIIIITGVCLGGETGFLVGALTGFVSNFFFGQGPWTPWQMFALGIIGFLSGMIFKKKKNSKILLCIFGAFSTVFIYGGIMNPASVMMHQTKLTFEIIASAYAAGIYFDLIHAASTFMFLWFLARPVIDELERIKIKYGISE